MAHRNYYIFNLKDEDFLFTKPQVKATTSKPKERSKLSDKKLKGIEEEDDQISEEEEDEEEYNDYDYHNEDEHSSDKEKKQALYRPSVQDIDEWLQVVDALSPRSVKYHGRLFGDLEPVPLLEALDPPPGSCFNCWQVGHQSRNCPAPRAVFCINCGRRDETVANCPRCSRQQLGFFARRRGELWIRNSSSAARTSRAQEAAAGGTRDCPEGQEAAAEKAIRARSRSRYEGPTNGGRASGRTRTRSRRRRSRQAPERPEEKLLQREEKAAEEGRDKSHGAVGDAARRERTTGVAVQECSGPEVVVVGTEPRRIEERQRTEGDHVARQKQTPRGEYRAEVPLRYGGKEFVGGAVQNDSRVELKKGPEEQKILMNQGCDEYLRLLERIRYLGEKFCILMKAIRLTRSEIDKVLVLLEEIQHFDKVIQEWIILDELLSRENREPKWWRVPAFQNYVIKTLRLFIQDSDAIEIRK